MTPSLLTLFGKSLNDFFSAKILTLTLFPALFGIVLWGSVFYAFGNEIYTYLSQMLLGFMPDWLNTQGTAQSILSSIIRFSLSFALYALFGIFFLMAILLTNMLFFYFLHAFYCGICADKKLSSLAKGGVWLTI